MFQIFYIQNQFLVKMAKINSLIAGVKHSEKCGHCKEEDGDRRVCVIVFEK